mmetsp:Transcript_29272/g.64753  ORF Transcript_29272/g.64753 Transcript_29272/m.64753 type:complete len:705 (-) Transcript_29272:814-2928(-)
MPPFRPKGQAHHHHVHTYVKPPNSSQHFSIIKRFEFSAALQRNVVVVRGPDNSTSVFAKGSPEAIRRMVEPGSVPGDFDALLGSYTREGLRVLALAQGDVSLVPDSVLLGWSQEDTERHAALHLVGLAVMANPLRPDTAEVVRKLQDASIRTVMVTGDHVRTAISVAHLCFIMPAARPILLVDGSEAGAPGPAFHLSVLHEDGRVEECATKGQAAAAVLSGAMQCAVTGRGFNRLVEGLDPDLLPACLQCASVFARMSPDNKRDLMELLGDGIDVIDGCPHLGLHVGFCGDGANDCGALKAAHVGVSLCEAEASVAAPMTSKQQSIASMVKVVSEGRCTLMATYQIFQFIIGYALVQAFETNLMYTYALNVGNYQFLIQDLFFTTVLAAFMGFTEPRSKLSRQKPMDRVMSLPLLVSTVLQLVVVVVFQLLSLWLLSRQAGYEPTLGPPDLRLAMAPENTTTYLVALSQYIILALVFNKGAPHRSPIYTNITLLASIAAQVAFVLYSLYAISPFNQDIHLLVDKQAVVTERFRTSLLLLMLANGVCACVMEGLSGGITSLVRLVWKPAPRHQVPATQPAPGHTPTLHAVRTPPRNNRAGALAAGTNTVSTSPIHSWCSRGCCLCRQQGVRGSMRKAACVADEELSPLAHVAESSCHSPCGRDMGLCKANATARGAARSSEMFLTWVYRVRFVMGVHGNMREFFC